MGLEHEPSLEEVCHAALNSQPATLCRSTQQNRGIGECQFFFGICTDVQWAEIPDMKVHPGGTRFASPSADGTTTAFLVLFSFDPLSIAVESVVLNMSERGMNHADTISKL